MKYSDCIDIIRKTFFAAATFMISSNASHAGAYNFTVVPSRDSDKNINIKKNDTVAFYCSPSDYQGTIDSYYWSLPGTSIGYSTDQSPGLVTYTATGEGQTNDASLDIDHVDENGGNCLNPTVLVAHVRVFKIETETVATVPNDRLRRKVGVGEEVTVEIMPVEPNANWTIEGGGSIAPATGSLSTFTAGDSASSDTIKAEINGTIVEVQINVVEPSSESGTKVGVNPFNIPAGTQGAGLEIDVTVAPTDVSFANVEVWEGACQPTNLTGYFTNPQRTPPGHSAWPAWIPLSNLNQWTDQASFGGWPPSWSQGGYDWSIPFRWRVIGSTSSGKALANHLQQSRIIDSTGKSTTTKFGLSETRSP